MGKVLLQRNLWLGKVSLAYKSLPSKGFWEQFSRVDQIGVECKIRKLFPEPAKMGNFSRMENPRILRNIHPYPPPSPGVKGDGNLCFKIPRPNYIKNIY
jgi:hypothetical protein